MLSGLHGSGGLEKRVFVPLGRSLHDTETFLRLTATESDGSCGLLKREETAPE